MVLNPDVSLCARSREDRKAQLLRSASRNTSSPPKREATAGCGQRRQDQQTVARRKPSSSGDGNKEGIVAKLENLLNYLVLEETNTRSSVNYQAKVKNRSEARRINDIGVPNG